MKTNLKKFLVLLATFCMFVTVLTGCSSSTTTDETGGEDTTADTTTSTGPDSATFEELLEAGKENGNKVTVYTTHSVIESACEAFKVRYELDVEFECTQIGDTEQITKVATEGEAGTDGADIIFIQDGARVLTDLVDEGYVYNWYNEEIYNEVGEDCEPLLVWDYCNKVFIFNNVLMSEDQITNIWYVTDPEYAGTVKMKDPSKEGVNMNFLVNLTSDENAALLETAYKDYYGEDLVLDDDCPNAGYQFIKMMYNNNLQLGSSDGDMAKEIGDPEAQSMMSGLITLNKYKKNADAGYNLGYAENVTPVAGFIYPIYGLLTTNADNPDMAKAFLCWLYTEEGWSGSEDLVLSDGSYYKGMTGRFGDYSGNQNIASAEGDKSVADWKKILVVEDAEQAAEYRADVEDFILTIK